MSFREIHEVMLRNPTGSQTTITGNGCVNGGGGGGTEMSSSCHELTRLVTAKLRLASTNQTTNAYNEKRVQIFKLRMQTKQDITNAPTIFKS